MSDEVIGIDIGGTNIRVAIVTKQGEIRSISKRSSHPLEENLFPCLEEQIDILRGKEIKIGIGSAGPLNPKTGWLHSPENLECGEYPLKEKLIERFKATQVEVRNDLDAIALGYYHFGDGPEQGYHVPALAVIAPGTGLGSSILIDGQCYFGGAFSGYISLELGKAPYFGSTLAEFEAGIGTTFEDFTAGKGVIAIYEKLFNKSKEKQVRDIIDQASDPEKPWLIDNFATEHKDEKFLERFPQFENQKIDDACLNTYKNVGMHLGYAIASFVTVMNPDFIILEGSIGIKASDLMMDQIIKYYKVSVWPEHQDIPITVGKLEDAGVKGAASLVL